MPWYEYLSRLYRQLAAAIVLTALSAIAGCAATPEHGDFGGRWIIDGVSGDAIVETLPQDRVRLSLPKSIQTNWRGDAVLSRTGQSVFSAAPAPNTTLTMSLISPGKAGLSFTMGRNSVNFTMTCLDP